MANNHVQEGRTLSLIAPTGGVTSGMIYLIGNFIVIASSTVPEGSSFEGHIGEVWELPKVAANVVTQGGNAYLLSDGSAITTSTTGNTLVGTFIEPSGNGDALCKVLLKERV